MSESSSARDEFREQAIRDVASEYYPGLTKKEAVSLVRHEISNYRGIAYTVYQRAELLRLKAAVAQYFKVLEPYLDAEATLMLAEEKNLHALVID